MSLLAPVVVFLVFPAVADALTLTTKYTYTYNADGALTAVTRQAGQEEPDTKYLTWDNFVPDASDPTRGQLFQNNGRLMAIGPAPGTANAAERFGFDARDRLLSYSGPAGSEMFEYHAGGSMSASSTDADMLRFYYDDITEMQATNLYESADGVWSAYLEHVRFLSDGTQQVLFTPRKDVACTYDASADALQSYTYDAFGASPLVPQGGKYDLTENPFRYTGEYRDPVWGGYYLRARWYDPELPVFLSRDPKNNLSRYGYGMGNPVMRTDPTGEKSYMSEVGKPLGRFLKGANRGIIGHVWRIFFAPLAGALQIVADPGGFWHSLKTNRNNIDVFLALGVVTEAAGGVLDAGLLRYGVSYGRRFLLRTSLDVTLGAGQSVSAAASRGFRHFDWNTFGQGLEYTASAIGYRRLFSANVRKGNLVSSRAARVANNQVARNVDRLPVDNPLLSPSRSPSVVRESFDESMLVRHQGRGLLSPEEEVVQDVSKRQFDSMLDRVEVAEEAQLNTMRKVLGRRVKAFEGKKSYTFNRISRPPGLTNISEDPLHRVEEFGNQAQLHSENMIEELNE